MPSTLEKLTIFERMTKWIQLYFYWNQGHMTQVSLNFFHLRMSGSLAIFVLSLAKTNTSALFLIILLPSFGYCWFSPLIHISNVSLLIHSFQPTSTLNWKSLLFSVASLRYSLRYHILLLFPLIINWKCIHTQYFCFLNTQPFFTFCSLVFVPTKSSGPI